MSRFIKALEDPEKLNLLKDILKSLCPQTSYEDECAAFVDELDVIIREMEPYLV